MSANEFNDVFAQYGCVDAHLLSIDLMEGHDFEYWSASLLRKIGFIHVEVTPGSGDQGVDILAQKDGVKYAIQCKRYSHDLGNKPVQEVHAGKSMYNCHVGAVITNQYFTAGAKELAKATGVLLWDREWIKNHLETMNVNIPVQETSSYGDEMLPAAVDVILETGQASVSMLQHRLKLGYARAARIVDEMEEMGIVGPFQGAKPRTILITKDQWNRRIGRTCSPTTHLTQTTYTTTPDLDPVTDYEPNKIMIDIPDPSKRECKKYLTTFMCWFQAFLPFLKVSIRQQFWNGGTASILTFITTVFVLPILVAYFFVWYPYGSNIIFTKWWFWIIFCLIALSM